MAQSFTIIGLPRLTEISVTRGSRNSRFGFGSSFPDFGSVQVCIQLYTVYSCLNRTEITENRHKKTEPKKI